MKNYFVLIELPGGSELKFTDGCKSPVDFWRNAVRSIRKGRVNLICRRQDTGVSEVLHAYMLTAGHFKTFVLADVEMEPEECSDKKTILKKMAQSIMGLGRETVIHTCPKFQLVTIDGHASVLA